MSRNTNIESHPTTLHTSAIHIEILLDKGNTWFRILMDNLVSFNELILQDSITIFELILKMLIVFIWILFPSRKFKTIFINLYSIYDTNKDASFLI